MTKSPQAFRTISEVSNELDVPQHVLRFWESKFSQIRPMKRGGGRRYYRPEDVDLLRGIQTLLYNDGFTIKGVQKVFRDQGAKFVTETGRNNGTRPAVLSTPVPVSEPAPAPTEVKAAAPKKAIEASLSTEDRKVLQSALTTLKEAQSALKALKNS